jgi:hypothetical protein
MTLSLPGTILAQVVGASAALRQMSLAAYAPGRTEAFSCTRISSAWAGIGSVAVGSYYERYADIPGTGHGTVFLGIPGGGGGFGFLLEHAGDAGYGETRLGFAYARNLSKDFRLGVRIDRFQAGSAAYGRAVAWPFEFSLSAQVSPSVMAGMSLHNPLHVSLPVTYSVTLPRVFRAGFGVRVNPDLVLAAEWESTDRSSPSLALALACRYLHKMFIQLGYSTGDNHSFLGMGFGKKGLSLVLTTTYHPALGWTSGLLLQWTKEGK